ncbi:hypothetical protein [Hoeflea sp.]
MACAAVQRTTEPGGVADGMPSIPNPPGLSARLDPDRIALHTPDAANL